MATHISVLLNVRNTLINFSTVSLKEHFHIEIVQNWTVFSDPMC